MASFKLVYLFILLSFINLETYKAQVPICSDSVTTAPNSAFESNLRTIMSYLSFNATANKQFYNTTVANRNRSDIVYGMFVCWGDVPPELCSQCVANATKEILSDSYRSCSSLPKENAVQKEECTIRYSNTSFFSTAALGNSGECGADSDMSNQRNFKSLLSRTTNEVINEATNSPIGAKKYATKQSRISGFQTLYCQAQCTPDLSPQDCRKCLKYSQNVCSSSMVVDYVSYSCKIGCELYPFYRPSAGPSPSELISVTNFNTYSQGPIYLSHNCSSNQTTDTTFLSNLSTLLSDLYSNSTTTKNGFFQITAPTVSGFFMCLGDFDPTFCQQCVLNAIKRISSLCPSSEEAIIWYSHCFLRYSISSSSLSTLDTTPNYHRFNIVNITKPNQLRSFFTWTLAKTLNEVRFDTEGSTVKNYNTKAVKLNDNKTLYTLVQCKPDLSSGDCSSCLENIIRKEIPWCCLASPEGTVLYPSCYVMFGMRKFYPEVEARKPARPPPKQGNKIIVIVVLVVVSVILFFFLLLSAKEKNKKKQL